MRDLSEFTYTSRYDYYPVTTYDRTFNERHWTVVLHERSCRSAGKEGYVGRDGQSVLKTHGLDVPTVPGSRTVFRGCKTCGTANITNEEWADMVVREEEMLQRLKAEVKAKSRQWQAESHAAAEQRRFGEAAEAAFYRQFAEQAEAVRLQAIAEWREANPAKATMADAHAAREAERSRVNG